MIRFISTEGTLDIRSSVLREGMVPELCRFDGDDDEDTFHLGYYKDDELICIGSFHKQAKEAYEGVGYQLRGMATLFDYHRKGIGNQLLNFAIVYLKGKKVNYIWCNARINACRFYLGIGFEIISDEFEIEGVGPHRLMYLKIQ
ncbi:MAG: GNAT family N-acetyltransferase [Daejeonella sp.]|uniref:GNAT family N-acetyltransferase n=1 Tax=Daejeonella sp. TaxID=2805397 RepID=UPI002732573D|nr:GNAT family N-acetyltransferase [Daejeonella sp.]MDP3468815.1 GNAT family N-acetyltransferase [Daejeonella sp.]